MIKVKIIIPQTVECFDNNNKSLGLLNEYEFLDLRVQIRRTKTEGYYTVFKGKKITIDTDGKLVGSVHKSFFSLHQDLLIKLF